MTEYTPKPAQFRLPAWAHEFLVQETASRPDVTKTDVVLEALECLRQKRFVELMERGYRECAEWILQEVQEWDATLADGLEDEEW